MSACIAVATIALLQDDFIPWGNVCPARARHATFLLTIPTSAPDLPSHGEAPQVDHIALHTFPTKHVAKQSNICEFNHSNCHL